MASMHKKRQEKPLVTAGKSTLRFAARIALFAARRKGEMPAHLNSATAASYRKALTHFLTHTHISREILHIYQCITAAKTKT
jgi:hypothetical protein